MTWANAAYAGATNKVLVHWAKDMWWPVWQRQSRVNYVGMWKRKFEKEDKKLAKSVQEMAEVGVEKRGEVGVVNATKELDTEKNRGRLVVLNRTLGLVDGEAGGMT